MKFDISDSMYSRVRQDFGSRVDGMVEDSKGYVWLTVSDGGIMKSTTPVFSLDTHFEPWKKHQAFPDAFIYIKVRTGISGWVIIGERLLSLIH